MKGMPLPFDFDFEGKGFLDSDFDFDFDFDFDLELIVKKKKKKNSAAAANTTSSSVSLLKKTTTKKKNWCYSFGEPTSVLDSAKISSRPASSSTLSSSLGAVAGAGAGASTDTAPGVGPSVSDTNPSPGWPQESATATSSNAGGAESELFPLPPPIGAPPEKFAMEDWESVLSESQDQSILRWIMADNAEDPDLNRIGTSTPPELDFGGADQYPYGGADHLAPRSIPHPLPPSPYLHLNNPNFNFNSKSPNFPSHINPNFNFNSKSPNFPNPNFFFPHDQYSFTPTSPPPPAKRHHSGDPDESGQQQQAIVDHLYKAAELVQTGNPILAQGILARLNHHLSPAGNPFTRAAYYCKEALLQSLTSTTTTAVAAGTLSSPINLIFKIAAYKLFSEVSPIVHFANFTSNQALLESFQGFPSIHILDFDIGYGGQWASLMQELVLRTGGAPTLKITAVAAAAAAPHDRLKLSLTGENLIQFAQEINIPFHLEIVDDIEKLNSNSNPFLFRESDTAIAVNLPVDSLVENPAILSFVKNLSPRIVVTVDRGCDRSDLPIANHVIHTLQTYSNLLESLDAGNVNIDAMQKIERLLFQPRIEKIVAARFLHCPEKTTQQHWRALFVSSGFSPATFSNFAESQAECVVKRVPIRGFQVERRQSSLVLCWRQKELISATAWRC
ncbi:scarecrow-like protein 6 [Andrographis paniculata]|uniref:scarecrow-like protein 6 n=1 Tax=Andrographis paniculata TaxID=175694 RepID=UPI0021E9200C|nr:scarecrow-like protein 6 [Andrographis paniculata]